MMEQEQALESSGANWEPRGSWTSSLDRETSDLGRLVWDDLSLDALEARARLCWPHAPCAAAAQLATRCRPAPRPSGSSSSQPPARRAHV